MTGYKTILVTYDFSDSANKALKEASFLAGEFGATLHIVHVIEDEALELLASSTLERMRAQITSDMTFKLSEFKSQQPLQIHVETGTIHKTVITLALRLNVDLIVTGSHSRSKLGYAFLGSTADKIASFSPVPVLVMHGKGLRQGLTSMIPLESSSDAKLLVHQTKPLAGAHKLNFKLLHALDAREYYDPKSDEILNARLDEAKNWLSQVSSSEKLNATSLVTVGAPSQDIIEQSQSSHTSLVAILTHGRKGVKESLLGSTAKAVCRYACCPVLVVPSEEHRQRILAMKDYFADKKISIGNILF